MDFPLRPSIGSGRTRWMVPQPCGPLLSSSYPWPLSAVWCPWQAFNLPSVLLVPSLFITKPHHPNIESLCVARSQKCTDGGDKKGSQLVNQRRKSTKGDKKPKGKPWCSHFSNNSKIFIRGLCVAESWGLCSSFACAASLPADFHGSGQRKVLCRSIC
jgi:hypothetical protein